MDAQLDYETFFYHLVPLGEQQQQQQQQNTQSFNSLLSQTTASPSDGEASSPQNGLPLTMSMNMPGINNIPGQQKARESSFSSTTNNNSQQPPHSPPSLVPSPPTITSSCVVPLNINNLSVSKDLKRARAVVPVVEEEGDEEERQKARRANQNLACRNYRKRKKEHMSDLEAKIAKLEAENDQLRKENLALTNSEPRETTEESATMISADMRQIVTKLDEVIKSNADDRTITYLIQLFYSQLEQKFEMVSRDIEHLVSPLSQAKLATLGYTTSMENTTSDSFAGPQGDPWWEEFFNDAKVHDDQRARLSIIRKNFYTNDIAYRNERLTLDKEIKDFFLKRLKIVPTFSTEPTVPLDMSEVVEFARKLYSLKKNFNNAKAAVMDTQRQMGAVLNPKQHALFLTKVNAQRMFEWPKHVQTIKSAWQLFSEGDKITRDTHAQNPPSSTSSILSLLNSDTMKNLPTGPTIPASNMPTFSTNNLPTPFPTGFGFTPPPSFTAGSFINLNARPGQQLGPPGMTPTPSRPSLSSFSLSNNPPVNGLANTSFLNNPIMMNGLHSLPFPPSTAYNANMIDQQTSSNGFPPPSRYNFSSVDFSNRSQQPQ